MMRILFFLLLAPFLAFADPNQVFSESEDPTIFHHVNVITGNLNISFLKENFRFYEGSKDANSR